MNLRAVPEVVVVALRQLARVQRAGRAMRHGRVRPVRSLRRSPQRYSSQRDEFHLSVPGNVQTETGENLLPPALLCDSTQRVTWK